MLEELWEAAGLEAVCTMGLAGRALWPTYII